MNTERCLLALAMLAGMTDGACLERPAPTPGETHSGRGPYKVAPTPDGTLHAYLLARMWGYAGEHLWRETFWGFEKVPGTLPSKATSWSTVFAEGDDRSAWAWRRIRLSSYWEPANKLWDFWLDRTVDGYELVGAWPAADITKAICRESPTWSRFRPDHPPSVQEREADADRMRLHADDSGARRLASQQGFRDRSRALFGIEKPFRANCADACSPNATTRDCDLCICLGEKIGAAECDRRAGR